MGGGRQACRRFGTQILGNQDIAAEVYLRWQTN